MVQRQDKLGASYGAQQAQPGLDIGGKINAGLYEGIKGGLQVGLGFLRGMAMPFAVWSYANRRQDFLPLPGTYGLDDQNQVDVNRFSEKLTYTIGTVLGVVTDVGLAGLVAVSDSVEPEHAKYVLAGFVATNVASLVYEFGSSVNNSMRLDRWRNKASTRKGVGAPRLRD